MPTDAVRVAALFEPIARIWAEPDEAPRIDLLRRPGRRPGCPYLQCDGAPGAGRIVRHPPQLAGVGKTFEYGTWGGEIRPEFESQPGDMVALEHWCSSGFANTDLDLQLKKHGIHQLIVIGLIAHTCAEATVRYGVEPGYEVTMVKDATASYSDEEMRASLDINISNYATDIVTTNEVIDSISGSRSESF